MNADQIITTAARIGLRVVIQPTRDPAYQRGYIYDPERVSLGRVTLHHGRYSHVKWYMRPYGDLHPSEFYAFAWARLIANGDILTQEHYNRLVAMAERLQQIDIESKKRWRRFNPIPARADGRQRHRKAVTGRSVRAFLRDLLEVPDVF